MGFIGLISRSRLRQTGGVPGALRRLTDMGLSELALHESLLSEEAVGAAADLGVRLGAYGAHNAEQIARVLTARASTFTTDRPDIAVAMRRDFATQE